MNNDLLFDFNVDKAAKTVYITREFNARQALVWDAFTKAELLDQWSGTCTHARQNQIYGF